MKSEIIALARAGRGGFFKRDGDRSELSDAEPLLVGLVVSLDLGRRDRRILRLVLQVGHHEHCGALEIEPVLVRRNVLKACFFGVGGELVQQRITLEKVLRVFFKRFDDIRRSVGDNLAHVGDGVFLAVYFGYDMVRFRARRRHVGLCGHT